MFARVLLSNGHELTLPVPVIFIFIFIFASGEVRGCLLIICGVPRPASRRGNEKRSAWTCWGQEWSLATEALPVDGDRMTALIHYERQRWKKVNFFTKKKLLPRSLFQHVQTLCMPSFIDLHTHATAGHVTSFACTKSAVETLPIDCWHDRTTRRSTQPRWNMKHFRQTARGCLTAPVDLLACSMQ